MTKCSWKSNKERRKNILKTWQSSQKPSWFKIRKERKVDEKNHLKNSPIESKGKGGVGVGVESYDQGYMIRTSARIPGLFFTVLACLVYPVCDYMIRTSTRIPGLFFTVLACLVYPVCGYMIQTSARIPGLFFTVLACLVYPV